MRRAWLYLFFAVITLAAVLVVSTGGAAQPALTEGTPTVIGTGGRWPPSRRLPARPLSRRCVTVRTRSTLRWSLHPCWALPSRSRAASAAAASWSSGRATAASRRSTTARPRRLRCDPFLPRKRNAAAVQRRALQRPVRRRARHRARLGRGPESLRNDVARGGAAARIEVARDGFVIDPTFFSQTQQNIDFFDDVPSTRALYLDPDGTPRDVGTVLRNPGLARAYGRIAHLGARASTAARLQTRWSRRFGTRPSRRMRTTSGAQE